MPAKEETVTYYQCLYRVLHCLHSLGLVDVRAGHVLDEFLREEPSEDNCVKNILIAFRKKIQKPQSMIAHFLRVDSSSVSNLESVINIHDGYMTKIDSILRSCGQCGRKKRRAGGNIENPGPSKIPRGFDKGPNDARRRPGRPPVAPRLYGRARALAREFDPHDKFAPVRN